ncbi:MAG: hypothetical protein KJ709_09730 [Nanoarchaeota archaeon]|nr:hypothetical protein [Nanoarchaeota archaeon]
MNKKTIATMIFLLIFLSACIIRPPPRPILKEWVTKQLTICNDEITPEMSEGEISEYYMERGIRIFEVVKETNISEDCNECECMSNVIVRLLVNEDDVMYFLDQGYEVEGIIVEKPEMPVD